MKEALDTILICERLPMKGRFKNDNLYCGLEKLSRPLSCISREKSHLTQHKSSLFAIAQYSVEYHRGRVWVPCFSSFI